MKLEEFAKNSQTDFDKKCFIWKLHILQATFAGNDVAIFLIAVVFLNLSNFMYIYKPQWRLKTSFEVHHLNPDLHRTCSLRILFTEILNFLPRWSSIRKVSDFLLKIHNFCEIYTFT